MTAPPPPTRRPPWRAWLRLGGLIAHLLAGLVVVALVFPLLSYPRRNALKAAWSRRLLSIMGLQLRVVGKVPQQGLLVANHISWLDIYVINATQPTGFVAKSEIRGWPLIGWLAEKTETIFIERGSPRHAQHVAHRMAGLLAAGHSLSVFPEGTTSAGHDVQPFHAALLQPAISCRQAIQPLAIRYRDAAGKRSTAPAFIDQMSFFASVHNTLAEPGLVAELLVLPALPTGPESQRRELAAAAEAAIRTAIGAERAA